MIVIKQTTALRMTASLHRRTIVRISTMASVHTGNVTANRSALIVIEQNGFPALNNIVPTKIYTAKNIVQFYSLTYNFPQ